MLLSKGQLCLGRLVKTHERLLEQPVGDRAQLLGRAHVAAQGGGARLLEDARGVFVGQSEDAPHAALADSTLSVEQPLTQGVSLRTDGFGLGQQIARLARAD